MKSRLSDKQRIELTQFVMQVDSLPRRPSAHQVAESASIALGFEANVNHVVYARQLIKAGQAPMTNESLLQAAGYPNEAGESCRGEASTNNESLLKPSDELQGDLFDPENFEQTPWITYPEDSPPAPPEPEMYGSLNATATHSHIKPWELTEAQRSIETLERLRRVETLLNRVAAATGAHNSSPPIGAPRATSRFPTLTGFLIGKE